MPLVRRLFSIAYWLFFVATALPGFLILLVVSAVTAPFDPDRRVVHAFVCRYSHAYLHIPPGWHVTVEGRALLPSGPAVIVANHQSMADVAAAMGLYHPFKFVSKGSLFSVPLIGWCMKLARYVRVERGRAHSMMQMMEDCRGWLRRGMPVLLFPEGTYAPGGRMLPFRKGAFVLAIEERVPLVPVVIEGTPGLIFEDGPWLSPTCHIRVRVLSPIPVSEQGSDAGVLAAAVQRRFRAALGHEQVAEGESST